MPGFARMSKEHTFCQCVYVSVPSFCSLPSPITADLKIKVNGGALISTLISHLISSLYLPTQQLSRSLCVRVCEHFKIGALNVFYTIMLSRVYTTWKKVKTAEIHSWRLCLSEQYEYEGLCLWCLAYIILIIWQFCQSLWNINYHVWIK